MQAIRIPFLLFFHLRGVLFILSSFSFLVWVFVLIDYIYACVLHFPFDGVLSIEKHLLNLSSMLSILN